MRILDIFKVIRISLKQLEQTGALEILYFLYNKKRAKLTDILSFLRDNQIGQGAMYNAIKALKESNLIDDDVEGFPRRRMFFLTKKGEKIARIIVDLKNALEQES